MDAYFKELMESQELWDLVEQSVKENWNMYDDIELLGKVIHISFDPDQCYSGDDPSYQNTYRYFNIEIDGVPVFTVCVPNYYSECWGESPVSGIFEYDAMFEKGCFKRMEEFESF